jgi:hypothetical protein
MNQGKFILYTLALLVYLTLSKIFSPSEYGISYILDEKDLAKLNNAPFISAILIDQHSTGFLMKTYYHKYRLIYSFKRPNDIIVRTSRQYFENHRDHIGLSLLRRNEYLNYMSYSPLPPGYIFLDNKDFGSWKSVKKGKEFIKFWRFHRTYRTLYKKIGVDKDFVFTEDFYNQAKLADNTNTSFKGVNNNFGTRGKISQKAFPDYFQREKPKDINFKKFLLDYFKENY